MTCIYYIPIYIYEVGREGEGDCLLLVLGIKDPLLPSLVMVYRRRDHRKRTCRARRVRNIRQANLSIFHPDHRAWPPTADSVEDDERVEGDPLSGFAGNIPCTSPQRNQH